MPRHSSGLGVLMLLSMGLSAWLLHFSLKPRILIVNASGQTLHRVALLGNGFDEHVGDVDDGATRCVLVDPSGESGLALALGTGDSRVEYGDLAYLEPFRGYRVRIVVKPDLTLDISTGAFHLLPWCTAEFASQARPRSPRSNPR